MIVNSPVWLSFGSLEKQTWSAFPCPTTFKINEYIPVNDTDLNHYKGISCYTIDSHQCVSLHHFGIYSVSRTVYDNMFNDFQL